MKEKILKITIVDDDQDDREYFQEALMQVNSECKLSVYQDGRAVMQDIREERFEMPDLMFLDLNMPLLSGKELLEKMRKIESFKDIPIIAIYSTSSSFADKEATFSLGANAYVSKPNNFNDIKEVLKKILDIDWKSYKTDQINYVILP